MVDTYAVVDRMDVSSASASSAGAAADKYTKLLEENPNMAFPAPFETSYLKAMMISGDNKTIIERSEQYND